MSTEELLVEARARIVWGDEFASVRHFLSGVWIGPRPEPRKMCSLLYRFGENEVTISTTADMAGDPFIGQFAGAGYSLSVTGATQTTSRVFAGQHLSSPRGR